MGAGAADIDQYVPSNWGGWQNLSLGTTDTTYHTTGQLPMEVQVSGKTIHVVWTDWQPNAAGEYCLWYRRSTDAGKTWEPLTVGGHKGERTVFCKKDGKSVVLLDFFRNFASKSTKTTSA